MADTFLILVGIGALVVCLLITLFLLLVYSGLFVSVEVGAGRPPISDVVIAYKFVQGPYKEAGPNFTEVAKLAPDNKALGIYYDDPNVVEGHKLRYTVASILAEGGQTVDEEMKKKFLDKDYKIHNLPFVSNVVKTKFPYASLISLFIAIYKVYPKIGQYIEEHKLCAHPCLEIYDGKNIHFMAPLARQDEFYVPEYSQCESQHTAAEDMSYSESLSDESVSYSEPSISEPSHSLPTDLTASGDMKMAAVHSGAGEAKNLSDSGFSSEQLASSLTSSHKSEETVDTGSEGSSGSPFEEVKVDAEDLLLEMTEQAKQEAK